MVECVVKEAASWEDRLALGDELYEREKGKGRGRETERERKKRGDRGREIENEIEVEKITRER